MSNPSSTLSAKYPRTRKTVYIVGAAFAYDKPNMEREAWVDQHGTVRIFDDISNSFTACHSLTEPQMEAIRAAREYQTIRLSTIS